MKKIYAIAAFLAALLTAAGAFAAAPERLTYQGTLRKDGRLFNGTAAMEFRIVNAASSVEYWASGSTDVVVSTGLFRYPLGTPNAAQFSAIVWKDIVPYVQVKLDGSWLPAEPLYSSAYSLHSVTAESSTGTFTVNDGNLRLTGAAGAKGVIFPDNTVQYAAPGWAVSTNGAYSVFTGRGGLGALAGPPAAILDVQADGPTAQIWRDSAGVIRSSMTETGILYADASQLRNLPVAADNMGNHTATQALAMGGFAINNAGAVSAAGITATGQFTTASSATIRGTLGLGAPRLSFNAYVEISSAPASEQGGVYVSSHIFLGGGARYYGDGSALTGVAGSDNLGDHAATQPLNLWGYQLLNAGHITASSATLTLPQGLGAPRLRLAGGVNLSSAAAAEYGGVYVSSHVFIAPGARLYTEAAVFTLQDETNPGLIVSSGLVVTAGNIGVGVPNPQERIEVNGGIKLDTTSNNVAGTIRYTGAAFEGYTGGSWVVLNGAYTLQNSVLWAGAADTIYAAGVSSSVAVGTTASGISRLRVRGLGNTSAANAFLAESQDQTPLLTVRNDGRIALGNVTPEARLDVRAVTGDNYSQVWRSDSGVVRASMTETGVLYADGSQLRNMPVDGLGTHTAAQDLDLSGFAIKSAGGITATGQVTAISSITITSGIGLLAPRVQLSPAAVISSATAAEYSGVYVSTHIYLRSGARYYGDGSALVGIAPPDNLGDHGMTANLRAGAYWLSGDGANEGLSVNSDGQVGVGVNPASARLEINDADASLLTSGVKFTNFSCSGTDKLTVNVAGNLVCTADQAGSGTGNLIDNLADTLAAGTDAGGRGMVNLDDLAVGRGAASVRLDVQPAGGDTHTQYWRDAGGVLVASMTAGGVLYADGSGLRNIAVTGDNMGTHTAGQTLNMNGFAIRGAAGLTSAGDLTVYSSGTFSSDLGLWAARLNLAQGVELSSAAPAAYGGLYVSTHVYLQSGAKYYGDGSGLSNIDAADDLGSHTAAQGLNMAGFAIVSASSLTVAIVTSESPSVLFAKNVSVAGGVSASGDIMAGAGPQISTISSGGYLALANLSAQPGGAGAGALYYNPAAFAGQGALYINLNGAFLPIATGTVAGGAGLTGVVSEAGQFSGDGAGVGTKLQLKASSVTLQGNVFNGAGQLVLLDGAGKLPAVDGSALTNIDAADDLGDHTAAQALNLAGFALQNASWISPAANTPGVMVSTALFAASGLFSDGLRLSSAAAYAGNIIVVSTGVSDVFRVTGAGGVHATRFYGDGSGITNVGGADNLGNHALSQNLSAGSYWLSGDGGNEGISINSDGQVGVGVNPASASFEVNDADGNALTSGVKFTNFICSGTDKLTTDASGNLICSADQTGGGTGNIIDNLGQTLAAGTDAGTRGMGNLGSVALGLVSPETRLDVQGAVGDTYAQFWRDSGGVIQASMTAGGVLYADASQLRNLPVVGGADNLGNHTAAQFLNMAGFMLVNASTITAASNDLGIVFSTAIFVGGSVYSSGGAIFSGGPLVVGSTIPAASLHVSSAAGFAGNLVMVSTGAASVFRVTGAGGVYATKYYGDGSALTGSGSDNLGNHIATTDINMMQYNITNSNSVEISSRLAVGNNAALNPTAVAMIMGVSDEADIGDYNMGVGAIGLVDPAGHKAAGQVVVGGDFRGGLAPGNIFNFPVMYGVRASAWAHTTGTVGKAYGVYVQNEQSELTGTVTSNVGVYVDVPNSTGTLTTNTGVFIADQSTFGTTHRNLHSAGANSVNLFDGAVRAGRLQLSSKSMAQLLLVVPAAEGEAYYCNNCSPKKIVVSTGTAAGNFADAAGGTFR